MRIIFVGIHNKPFLKPLDSSTKTGKLIDRIIKKLPADFEIVKSNIIDNDGPVPPNQILDYANEWYWNIEPQDNDVIVLLGVDVQKIHKNLRQVGNLIKVAHPAYKKSHIAMNEYVEDVACKIKNYCT